MSNVRKSPEQWVRINDRRSSGKIRPTGRYVMRAAQRSRKGRRDA